MLLKCDNCGAPLDVKGDARRTRCNYCGKTTQAGKLEHLAEETPQGWEPPKEWSPPAESRLAGQSLVYKPVRAIGRALSLAIRLGIFAVVGTAAWRLISVINHTTNQLSSGAQQAELQGAINKAIGDMTQQINAAAEQAGTTSPDGTIGCSGVDVVTLSAKTIRAEGAAGVAVTASGNCRVKLMACRVSGKTAVVVRDNARVSIEGGSITGVQAAAILDGNAALDATGGATITGAPAVSVSGNARATLRDVSVNGALDTKGNASIDAVGAKLLGKITGTKRVIK